MAKYKLTNDSINLRGKTLFKIMALKDFTTSDGTRIYEGDIGGYIENERNLSHDGKCWVHDNAKVYGKAKVYEHAFVYDNAIVSDNARIRGESRVYHDAFVHGNATVFEYASIFGGAEVYSSSRIFGYSEIYGNAKINGCVNIGGGTHISNPIDSKIIRELIIDTEREYKPIIPEIFNKFYDHTKQMIKDPMCNTFIDRVAENDTYSELEIHDKFIYNKSDNRIETWCSYDSKGHIQIYRKSPDGYEKRSTYTITGQLLFSIYSKNGLVLQTYVKKRKK